MKNAFLSRVLREKILLVGFLAVVVIVWGGSVIERGEIWWKARQATSQEMAVQEQWLGEQDTINAQAAAALKSYDAEKTYNPMRLAGELDSLAKQAGITGGTRASDFTSEHAAQFAVHSLEYSITRGELGQLLKLYDLLAERRPYISIERFELDADRSNPALLNARLKLSSVEVAR